MVHVASLVVGTLFLAAAVGVGVGALAGSASGEFRFLGSEWKTLQLAFAGGMALVGLVALVAALREPREEPVIVPAHESFMRKTRHDLEPPVTVAPQQARAEDPEVARVSRELREVDLALKRANVMLGTGKLTREGYAQHVAELREKKGVLESELLRLQGQRAAR